MSALRLIREVVMLLSVTAGAAIGYAAGQSFESTTQVVLAFTGMGLAGAFADFCIRGGKN